MSDLGTWCIAGPQYLSSFTLYPENQLVNNNFKLTETMYPNNLKESMDIPLEFVYDWDAKKDESKVVRKDTDPQISIHDSVYADILHIFYTPHILPSALITLIMRLTDYYSYSHISEPTVTLI